MSGILGDQLADDTIPSAKLTPAARSEFGGTAGPAPIKSADYEITSQDQGQTFFVSQTDVRGTLNTGLADGFELRVVCRSPATRAIVQPPAGETITIPPGTSIGGAPVGGQVGGDAQAFRFAGSVWLKKSGATWVIIGITSSSSSFEAPAGTPAEVIITQGNGQNPTAGEPLDSDLVVEVHDESGIPVSIVVDVLFQVNEAGEVLNVSGLPTTVQTVDGVATVSAQTIIPLVGQEGMLYIDVSLPGYPEATQTQFGIAVDPAADYEWSDGSQAYGQDAVIEKPTGSTFELTLNQGPAVVDFGVGYDLEFEGNYLIENGQAQVTPPYSTPSGIQVIGLSLNNPPHIEFDLTGVQVGESSPLVVRNVQDTQVISNNIEVIGAPFTNFWAANFPDQVAASWLETDQALYGQPSSRLIVSLWHRRLRDPDESSGVEPVILNQWRNDSGNGGAFHWVIDGYQSGGQRRLRARFWDEGNATSWNFSVEGVSVFGSTSWQHLMVVFDPAVDNGGPRFYKNGVLDGQRQDDGSSGVPSLIYTNGVPLDVGARLTDAPTWAGAENQQSGELDEIATWDSAPFLVGIPSEQGYDNFASAVYNGGLAYNLNDFGIIYSRPNRWWRFETPGVLSGQSIQNGEVGLANSAANAGVINLSIPAGPTNPTYTAGPGYV